MTHTATNLFPSDRPFVSPAVYDAFFAVIERLEATIGAETEALAASRLDDLARFTRQKRQGFLELTRISRQLASTIPSQDILARLASFRTMVEANERALAIHLAAVKDVTAIIVRAIRDAESDGTYSRAYGCAEYDLA